MRAIDGDRIVKILNECIDKILAIQNLDITYNPKLSAELQVYKDMLEDINEMPTIEPEPQWIPCSERLPEKSGQYYVSGGNKVWICEFLIIPNFMGGWCDDVANPEVQAWMPCNIPEPYKEGE